MAGDLSISFFIDLTSLHDIYIDYNNLFYLNILK